MPAEGGERKNIAEEKVVFQKQSSRKVEKSKYYNLKEEREARTSHDYI